MKWKKMVSMLLIGGMAVSLLAGCGSSSEENVGNSVEGSAEEEENSEEAGFTGFDDTVEIQVYGMSLYGDSGLEEVMDAINAISEEEINVHVNYTAMDVSSYGEQIGLMIAGGETIDLMMLTTISSVSFSTMQSQNELLDITEYLEEYAPEMTELMEDYISATTVDGTVYGVPNYRIYNSSPYIIMRKDILDYLGLTEQAEAISSWSEYEEILLAVQAAQDELPEDLQTNSMVAGSNGSGSVINLRFMDMAAEDFSECYGYDVLGDSSKLIYVDEDGTVGNYFATDDYKTTIERVHQWYDEGLVDKDASTVEDGGGVLMKNGVTFSYLEASEIGVEASKKSETGYDVVCVKISDIPIQTFNGSSWGWCVPVTSNEPEAAVAFLNLMYTNEEIANLFVYGIEGRDYEVNDEGEAVILDGVEYQASDFLFGNQFLAYPAETTGGDFREVAMESVSEAEVSQYYGCTVNTDPIANELTAVSNVLSQYEPGLESGAVDISELDTMLAELETAGVQTIIDYYQECLDEWLAEQ